MFAYYIHDLDPIIFRIYDNVGPRWYGLAYVLAFICGYVLLRALSRLGYADLPLAKVADYITGCALFGVLIGARLRFFLQTGNAARADVDPPRLGRRYVEPRRHDGHFALQFVLRAPSQGFLAESWR